MISGSYDFCCLGVNHRTAPVALREKLSVPTRLLADATTALRAVSGVEECVLLSTCNRTEVYFTSPTPELSAQALLDRLLGEHLPLNDSFYLQRESAAIRHLAMVAAGLDSMVIGETEIFGQLKDAYRTACQVGTAGHRIHRLFQTTFSVAKKVRSHTHITSGPTSVGAVAVALAQRILGDLTGTGVLIVGAGDVARSTAQSLRSRGAQSIFVANRSYDRACLLAHSVGGSVIRFSDWVPYLEMIDIVIVSTSAPVYVVTRQVVEHACASRNKKTLFLIDLSVPRNIDPSCSRIPGAVLYDMDAMQTITRETMQYRQEQVQIGAAIIDEELKNVPL